MHTRSGGNIEVMGLMQGRVQGDTFIVMDSFALPVEGTETRVNALAEAYEYMVTYTDLSNKVQRRENVIGWYHSHPGYGCWLSGIDVSTQLQNQQYQDPWVAVVVLHPRPLVIDPRLILIEPSHRGKWISGLSERTLRNTSLQTRNRVNTNPSHSTR